MSSSNIMVDIITKSDIRKSMWIKFYLMGICMDAITFRKKNFVWSKIKEKIKKMKRLEYRVLSG